MINYDRLGMAQQGPNQKLAGGLVHQGPDHYDRSGLAGKGQIKIMVNYDGWGPGPFWSRSKL